MEIINTKNIQIKIKTICEFLFIDRFQDTATFPRFEKCFQPLFNNKNISMLKVFKEICGPKKKYITYKRLSKAYLNHLNKNDKSEDTKIFFNELFEQILIENKISLKKKPKKIYSFSNKKTCKNRECISMIQILSNKNGTLNGIILEYDGVIQSNMYKSNLEDDFILRLEMPLDFIDEKSKIEENIKKFNIINQGNYRDAITHIFGTINEEKGCIPYLGFKCISGKTVFVGFPDGKGFLLGKFGTKFHDLRVQMNENGITYLEPGFKQNLRKNFFLGNITEDLKSQNLDADEIIKDEEKLATLNDENEIDKLIMIDEYISDKNLKKDKICGNDYKEVVDQHPRDWIISKTKDKDVKPEPMTLIDALKLYDEECEKTKKKTTIISKKKKNKSNLNDNNYSDFNYFDLLINDFQDCIPFFRKGGIYQANIPFIPNPFCLDSEENEVENPFVNEDLKKSLITINEEEDENEYKEFEDEASNFEDGGLSLHKTRIFKPYEREQKKWGQTQIRPIGAKKIWNGIINEKTQTSIFINRNNYMKLKDRLKLLIDDELFENSNDLESIANDDNCKDFISPRRGTTIIPNYSTNRIWQNNKTQIKMKNLKGESFVLGGEIELNEDYRKLKLVKEKWTFFRKSLEKINGVHLLQTIGSVRKALHILSKKENISLIEKIKLYKILDENEKIIDFLSKSQNKFEEKEEEEEYEAVLIPDEHPEKIISLSNLQNVLDNLKDLLENKKLKEDDRKKLEQLRDLYLQQKNILIENETKKLKKDLFKKIYNKYIKEEKEKRRKAKEEEQKKLEEELVKRRDRRRESVKINDKRRGSIRVPEKQSIIVKKKSTRIFCNQKMPISSEPWEDDLFPPCKNSLCPNDENGFIQFTHLKDDDIDGWEYFDWCRVDELIENYNIFEDGADLDDIIQGDIADCYFLSALGSLCSYPEFFNKLMFSDQVSENHFYGIYLYLNGKWKLVLLDDYFPYKIGTIKEMCFSRSIQDEIWVSLVEKAWAKVNGCYARIGCGGYSYEAFDVLTEAFTEEISIFYCKKEGKIEELWEKMVNAFEKNYILTAGTPSASKVTEVGLVMGHAYTLVKVYKVNTDFGEERLVKLKNPYRDEEFTGDWSDDSDLWTDEIKEQCEFHSNDDEEENQDGIFYMSFNDFIEYFSDIDIAKVETGYQSTYYKIKKKYATKCQIIKLEVEEDNPNTFIQLYQKNPRILRKNGTYYPKMVMAFLILLDENFQYIKSASGVDMHMAIEVDLKKGIYYILCDVNYRNQTKDFKTYGYTVSFYSKHLITKFTNVTNEIDSALKLENAMINYCKKTIEPKTDDSGINIYDTEKNKDLPFRVFCFDNPTNDSLKVKFDVNFEGLKFFCFYNDSIASEFDSSVIKKINSKSTTAILILGYAKDYMINPEYKILSSSDQSTYENTHPVFNCNKKGFDEKGCLFSYELVVDNETGFIIGLENISNDNFKLKLNLSETYCIDANYRGKENIEFDILSQSKKVFNLRVKSEGKNPNFSFEEIK